MKNQVENPESWIMNERVTVPSAKQRKWKIAWFNLIFFTLFHIGALYGAYLTVFKVMWRTAFFAFFLCVASGVGVTAGAHRLWSHRSYKARLPLRILLVCLFTISFETSVIDWARDHRLHHKHSETDADPHNATRGFFFSHIGWMLVKKHPQVKIKGRQMDLSDLKTDALLNFQKKHFLILALLACFLMPTYVPTLWGESLWNGFFVCSIFRYIYVLNVTSLVNSVAHMFGNKPYDKSINPVEAQLVSLLVLGEGFHNYHHTFPWDYKTAELGKYYLNFTTLFLDIMARIGWAYDLKTVSPDVIKHRAQRTGDGSHGVWGWEDHDLLDEEKKSCYRKPFQRLIIITYNLNNASILNMDSRRQLHAMLLFGVIGLYTKLNMTFQMLDCAVPHYLFPVTELLISGAASDTWRNNLLRSHLLELQKTSRPTSSCCCTQTVVLV